MYDNLPGGCATNPHGCNPLGSNYIDYGLGDNPNPAPDGTKFYNTTPGDIPQFRGLFKTPSNRDVDLRPSPTFVKAYMHNGVHKSLQTVVHFYNTRNIAMNAAGQGERQVKAYPRTQTDRRTVGKANGRRIFGAFRKTLFGSTFRFV